MEGTEREIQYRGYRITVIYLGDSACQLEVESPDDRFGKGTFKDLSFDTKYRAMNYTAMQGMHWVDQDIQHQRRMLKNKIILIEEERRLKWQAQKSR